MGPRALRAAAARRPLTGQDRPNVTQIAAQRDGPVLDVVVPFHNEEPAPADSVRRLHRYLDTRFGFS